MKSAYKLVTPEKKNGKKTVIGEANSTSTQHRDVQPGRTEEELLRQEEKLRRQIEDLQLQLAAEGNFQNAPQAREADAARPSGTPTAVASSAPSATQMKVQVPKFLPGKPELWFAMLELAFSVNDVTSDCKKFAIAVNSLDDRTATLVADVILRPPAQQQYKQLKDTVVARTRNSEDERMRKVLQSEGIGDRKPSEFWRHLRNVVEEEEMSDRTLRHIWLSQLPLAVKTAVAACERRDVDSLLAVADRVHATLEQSNVSVVSQPGKEDSAGEAAAIRRETHPSFAEQLRRLQEQMEVLQKRLAEMAVSPQERAGDRKRGKQEFRRQNRGDSQAAQGNSYQTVCWYHRRFGEGAERCTSPCFFPNRSGGPQ